MKKFLLAMVGWLGLVGLAVAAHVEADPSKDYHVAPENGQWFICAAGYRGENAKELAHELVLEIRRKYNLPAYILDRGGEDRRKQYEEYQRMKAICPEGRFKIIRIEEQFAVLVGGYKDMETARKALDDVKKLPSPDPKLCYVGFSQEYGQNAQGVKGVITKQLADNPFMTAFVTHNPTIPKERDSDNWKADPFLKQLNSGSLSLLNNKKPWTLTVKVFSGTMMIQDRSAGSDNKFTQMLGMSKGPEILDAGAKQAHALADLLRNMKNPSFEAYVLHTRSQSIVTVGGYDRADDPRLIQDQQTLSKLKFNGLPPDMQLIPQPLPMEVPRPQ